jgi:hypothetical protein
MSTERTAHRTPDPTVTEHWCIGLDAGRTEGVCLHCATCAHLWRGQPGSLLHPPGRIVLGQRGAVLPVRVVVCALRSPVDDHGHSVAPLPRQVSGADASRVTAGVRCRAELGGLAM